jgi:hypothetical protein
MRARRVFGLVALDLSCNARVERTERDVRRDDRDYYYVSVQTGESAIIHDERVVNITAGDVVLLDARRPVTFASTAEQRHAIGLVCNCRARPWSRISASIHRVACAFAGRRKRHVFSTNSLLTRSAMRNRRLMNLCVWWSMTFLEHFLHSLRRLAYATPTNCSRASATSSRTALPILTSLRVMWLPRWEFRYAICRACSRAAVRHAVTTYLRSV